MPVTLSSTALTTVESVKRAGGKSDIESDQDQAIVVFINVVSDLVAQYTNREIKPNPDYSSARIFELDSRFLPFGAFGMDLQSASEVALDPDLGAGVPLASTLYRFGPTTKRHGVYGWLRFQTDYSWRHGWGTPRQVRITGTWGWPSVPAWLAGLVDVTVLEWLQRNQEVFATTFNLDTNRLDVPQELPSQVRSALKRIQRPALLPVG